MQPGIGQHTDLASLYGVEGPSKSKSSLLCDFLTGMVCGVVVGIVLFGCLPFPLLFVESFFAHDANGCWSSG